MLLNLKPRIFIGSSSEGLPIARYIKKELSAVAKIEIWEEDVFLINKSYLETLIEIPNLYDFAILVATKDDKLEKRKKFSAVPRDNIIFEFGLFMGRLSRNRVFIFKEEEADLPSDISGITVPHFTRNAKGQPTSSLQKECGKISKLIAERFKTYENSLLPSTALAHGYYNNFVYLVCKSLNTLKKIWLKDDETDLQDNQTAVLKKGWEKFELNIILPDDLPDNFHDKVSAYRDKQHLKKAEVGAESRFYNFFLNVHQSEEQTLKLYDMPTTLNGIKTAIEMYVPKTYIGEYKIEKLLIKKELNNFKKTLNYLIAKNDITKECAKVVVIDV